MKRDYRDERTKRGLNICYNYGCSGTVKYVFKRLEGGVKEARVPNVLSPEFEYPHTQDPHLGLGRTRQLRVRACVGS